MAVSKTRELLIEVARRQFAQYGIEKTTMNDIAIASKKGRRTLYTYFKNKEDIYYAVIESEQNKLTNTLWEVVNKDLPPDEKLLEYIYARLEVVKELVIRNGTLRAEFFQNIERVEQVRRKFDRREIKAIEAILEEGVKKNVFDIPHIELTASIMHHAFKGLEVPYIRESFAKKVTDLRLRRKIILDFILNGIKKKQTNY